MATGTSVSVQDYLHTTYHPDCDYVDGVVMERNLGEYDHAKLRMAVSGWDILSPDDRLHSQAKRFVAMGVRYVWILDSRTRKAHRVTAEGLEEVTVLRTGSPKIVADLAELFD